MTLVGAAVAVVFNASSKMMLTIEYFIGSLYQTISEDVVALVLASLVSTISKRFRASGES
jgi:hypothetical protein